MNSNYSMPMNLGNPDEYTIEQFALKIKDLVGMLIDFLIEIINYWLFSYVHDVRIRRKTCLQRACC
jgi:hypothetical protein